VASGATPFCQFALRALTRTLCAVSEIILLIRPAIPPPIAKHFSTASIETAGETLRGMSRQDRTGGTYSSSCRQCLALGSAFGFSAFAFTVNATCRRSPARPPCTSTSPLWAPVWIGHFSRLERHYIFSSRAAHVRITRLSALTPRSPFSRHAALSAVMPGVRGVARLLCRDGAGLPGALATDGTRLGSLVPSSTGSRAAPVSWGELLDADPLE
jgi:hypothetical protein